MSLIVLYKDEMVSDRCCVLTPPHAPGQTVFTKKIRIANNKTFAFASVGPTLTAVEQLILEEIIHLTFRMARGEEAVLDLEMPEWFETRKSMDMLVMTKRASYFMHLVGSKYDESEMFRPRNADQKKNSLIQFDSSIPATYGTGLYPAFIAASEGMSMKDIVPAVADIEYSVSPDYDIVNRRQLKRMTFK